MPDQNARTSSFFRRTMTILLLIGLFGAVGLWYFYPRSSSSGLEYQIIFKDARGLERGDDVTLAGIRVGEVRSVILDGAHSQAVVTVRIDTEHASAIHAPPESSARIISEGWLFPKRRVEIVNRGQSTTAMASGERIQGLETWASEQVFLGKARASEVIDQAQEGLGVVIDATGENLERAQQWAEGSEGREIRDKIESVRVDLEQYGYDAAGKAQTTLESLLAKGRDLSEDLYRSGQEDLASDLESTLIELKNRAVETIDEKRLEAQPEIVSEGVIMATPTPAAP